MRQERKQVASQLARGAHYSEACRSQIQRFFLPFCRNLISYIATMNKAL